MKKFFLIFMAGICLNLNMASAENCQTNIVTLKLNDDSSTQCESLKINGQYNLKICDTEKGMILGDNLSFRFLFKDADTWVARQDLLDYTNNISTTSILKIDSSFSNFSFSKTTKKRSGTILEQLNCAGTLQTQ